MRKVGDEHFIGLFRDILLFVPRKHFRNIVLALLSLPFLTIWCLLMLPLVCKF